MVITMDKETAELMAKELRHDIERHKLHWGDLEVEVVETSGVGWMVQVY